MNTFNLKLNFPNLLWEIAGYNFPFLFGKWAIFFIFIAISFQVSAQRMAIKTNTLEWLAASPNLGVEFPLNDWMTAEISASANPWKITDKLFYRHGRVQAEAKYWLRNLLARHYIGITGFYSMFDVGINRRAYYGMPRLRVSRMDTTGFCHAAGTLRFQAVWVWHATGWCATNLEALTVNRMNRDGPPYRLN